MPSQPEAGKLQVAVANKRGLCVRRQRTAVSTVAAAHQGNQTGEAAYHDLQKNNHKQQPGRQAVRSRHCHTVLLGSKHVRCYQTQTIPHAVLILLA